MPRALSVFAMATSLSGCAANLVVSGAHVGTWNATGRTVVATVENTSWLGVPLFCRDAGDFLVYFDGDELPTSDHRPQVSTSVAGLACGESRTLTADFTPLARVENNYLWNVTRVTVTADPKQQVPERNESDNVAAVRVPFSSELPIGFLDALGGTVVDEPKIPATLKLIHDPVGGRTLLTSPVDYDGRIGVELRGQLSATFCKKQYGLETWNAANDPSPAPLLQMPTEEDWVLYGPYDDKSLLRNVFAYGLSNLIGRYAPRTRFLELFVHDAGMPGAGCPPVAPDGYVGVYVLVEKIKRDAARVNVAKLTAADNAEPAVTGGYLLKKDWLDPGDATFTTSAISGYATRLTYVYPKCKASPAPCEATAQQKAWIEAYLDDFEAALKGAAFGDPLTGYAKYVDVDSFVDYYLLEELTKNSDGFRASTYMYKDRGGKLKMGPIWDMNFTMGNVGFPVARPPEGWLAGVMGDQMKWWGRLLQDRGFAQKVIDRWQSLRQGPFKTSTLHLTVDNLARQLRYAEARNFDRWPILGVYLVGNPTPVDPNETYGDAVQQVKTWLEARTAWIDANIAGILPP